MPQSALHPAGPHAESVATLWWIMAGGSGVILAVVMLLVLIGCLRRPATRARPSEGLFIVGGGILFPLSVLTALLVYALMIGPELARPVAESDLRVHVIGRQWWWEVRYPGLAADGSDLVSANEIRVPVGKPVQVTLESADVIHSFWVPSLGGKIDMIPGRTNRLLLQADRAGTFSGQCAEFCGLQHAFMSFFMVAESEDDYAAWLAREQGPAPEPTVPLLRQGRDAFVAAGCGSCHTVRGTSADGRIGPDLTHVGGRLSIGAGMMTTNVGTLAAWIAGSQHIKPGNQMPSFNVLDGPTLRSIALWLESLE